MTSTRENVDTVTLTAISTQYSEVQDYYTLSDQANAAVKTLRRACKTNGERGNILHVMKSVTTLARRTYEIQSTLGKLDASQSIMIILSRKIDDEELMFTGLRAILALISADTSNKIAFGMEDGCNFIVEVSNFYLPLRNYTILELCCLLIKDLGNAKFPAMVKKIARYDSVAGGMLLNTKRLNTPGASASADYSTFDSADDSALRGGRSIVVEAALTTANLPANSAESSSSVAAAAAVEVAVVNPNIGGETRQLWDNRAEMCAAGACEFLSALLQQEVGNNSSSSSSNSSNSSKIVLQTRRSQTAPAAVNEELIVACCDAVASLCTNDECSLCFSATEIFTPLVKLLSQDNNTKWNLKQCASWAILNLAADFKAGNREKFGQHNAIEELANSISVLTATTETIEMNQEKSGFHRLFETLLWALLNVCYGCDVNQRVAWRMSTRERIMHLRSENWLRSGAKQKLERLHRELNDFRVRTTPEEAADVATAAATAVSSNVVEEKNSSGEEKVAAEAKDCKI